MEDQQPHQELDGLKKLITELGEKISAAMERAKELENRLRDSAPESSRAPQGDGNP